MNLRRLLPIIAIFVLSFVTACIPKDQGGFNSSTSQTIQTTGHVLYISSYNPGFPTFSEQVNGIQRAFSGAEITLDIEFLDSKRLPDPEDLALFESVLTAKLHKLPPYDVIIAADDHAFSFALEQQYKLFNETPIVFLGVNNQDLATAQNYNPQVTGVVEAISPRETLKLMEDLHPKLTEVFIIVDGTSTGQADLRTTREVYANFPELTFTELSLTELTFDQLALAVSKLDAKHQAILLLAAYQDAAGTVNLFENSLSLIYQNTSAPIYHLWTHSLGQEVVGGKMVSHEEQGFEAGSIALQILQGTPVSTIPVIETSPNHYYFDAYQLKRFGISRLNLPFESTIINSQNTLSSRQMVIIIVIVLVLLGETALLFYLAYLNKRRKTLLVERDQAILELTEHKSILSGIFNEAPIIIILSDLNGEYYKANPPFEKTFGNSFSEAKDKMLNAINDFGHYKDWKEFQEILFEKGNITFEYEFQTQLGRNVPFRISVTPIPVNDQIYLLTIGQNLEERKWLEEERQRTQFAVDHSSVTILLADHRGKINYANQYACQELGYSFEELQNMYVWQLESSPQYAYDETSWVNEWGTFRKDQRLLFTTEYRRKDGDVMDVTVSSNYFEFDGQEFAWIFANNINRVKQAQDEAILAREELEHAYLETIQGWAKALELRDFETAGHAQRVSQLSTSFAQEMNFTKDQTLDLNPWFHSARYRQIGYF